ncbi:hypothetical protein PSP6_180088 [Paraburkholderia tropica]|nr:hypothetical protein PSP6_180088 [Paraburkholderia tropica]
MRPGAAAASASCLVGSGRARGALVARLNRASGSLGAGPEGAFVTLDRAAAGHFDGKARAADERMGGGRR